MKLHSFVLMYNVPEYDKTKMNKKNTLLKEFVSHFRGPCDIFTPVLPLWGQLFKALLARLQLVKYMLTTLSNTLLFYVGKM